jgi:hypothetical protein
MSGDDRLEGTELKLGPGRSGAASVMQWDGVHDPSRIVDIARGVGGCGSRRGKRRMAWHGGIDDCPLAAVGA